MNLRLPDFIIVGTMKSGTTTLFRWLEMQPECELPSIKEINFFTIEENWRRGLPWYCDFFSSVSDKRITGEATPRYTDPRTAATTARRIHATLPSIRIIAVLRDPFERMRSHYRYAIQRGYESRPFLEAITDSSTNFVGRSQYWKCLRPYTELFSREQICLVRFEDLYDHPHEGWNTILRFLELEDRAVPATVYNVTARKRQFSKTFRFLWKSGLLRRLRVMPMPVKRAGKMLLTRDNSQYRSKMETSHVKIPPPIRQEILDDIGELENWLQFKRSLWPQIQSADHPKSFLPFEP